MLIEWKQLQRLGNMNEEWILVCPTVIGDRTFTTIREHLAKIKPTNDGRYELTLRPQRYCSFWLNKDYTQARFDSLEVAKKFAETYLDFQAIDKLGLDCRM